MLVLFDNGTPRTLARYLIDHHTVTEARARGWAELENGELLNQAESAGFEVFITTDKNLGYQQNFADRKIAIIHSFGSRTLDDYQAACCESRRGGECSQARQFR
jgi:hypothetical protein